MIVIVWFSEFNWSWQDSLVRSIKFISVNAYIILLSVTNLPNIIEAFVSQFPLGN